MSSSVALALASRVERPASVPKNVRFSCPVSILSTAAYWPVSEMEARTPAGSEVTSWPLIVALPPLIGMRVDSALISVVLPAPLAPRTARTLPRGIESVMPLRISFLFLPLPRWQWRSRTSKARSLLLACAEGSPCDWAVPSGAAVLGCRERDDDIGWPVW